MSSRRVSDSSLSAVSSGTSEASSASTSTAITALRREFEELGLSTYEARVLVALIQLGSATPGELARVAEVPRTSPYPVLDELKLRGLANRLPAEGPAVWTAPPLDTVLRRLEAEQEDRLREHKARAGRVRTMVAETFAETTTSNLPYVHVVFEPALVLPLYLQLLGDAREELLVFNRAPYSWSGGKPNPAIIDAVQRVQARALYEAPEVVRAKDEAWWREIDAYHAAGVEGRVVDELPLKLVVIDRKVALISLDNPELPNVGYPTVVLIEHPGFATVLADSFEHRWESALSYEEVRPPSALRRRQA